MSTWVTLERFILSDAILGNHLALPYRNWNPTDWDPCGKLSSATILIDSKAVRLPCSNLYHHHHHYPPFVFSRRTTSLSLAFFSHFCYESILLILSGPLQRCSPGVQKSDRVQTDRTSPRQAIRNVQLRSIHHRHLSRTSADLLQIQRRRWKTHEFPQAFS